MWNSLAFSPAQNLFCPKDLGPSNGRVWTCIAGIRSSKLPVLRVQWSLGWFLFLSQAMRRLSTQQVTTTSWGVDTSAFSQAICLLNRRVEREILVQSTIDYLVRFVLLQRRAEAHAEIARAGKVGQIIAFRAGIVSVSTSEEGLSMDFSGSCKGW